MQKKGPKVGIVANAITVFSLPGKEEVERQYRELFHSFVEKGLVDPDSVFYPERVFSPQEMKKAIEVFIQKMVDVVIVLDSAFPNGNTFLTLANDPYLFNIPLIVTAPQEIVLEKPEWTTNAWCGVIMNNFVAKRIGRYLYPLAGWPEDPWYREELQMLFRVFQTVKELRNDIVGRFGDAPGGFHSASGNQLEYARVFGTRVETIDWTAVMNTYRTGKAKGYSGEVHFSEDEVRVTAERMKDRRVVLVDDEIVIKAAWLYHAFRSLIQANGFTSAAFRCWPEMGEPYIGIAPCFSIGWLLAQGDVWAASCEGDWPTAVAQSLGTLLSGKPSACLDFVNYTGLGPVIQLGHCGVGIGGWMAPNVQPYPGKVDEETKRRIMEGEIAVNDAIAEKSPDRQGGLSIGPAHIGQFAYGVKTGINLIQDEGGHFKMLTFTGESKLRTAKGMLYSASDVEVKNNQKLNELILEHGFSHHLAMAFGDITKELRILCGFYGIEYLSAD
ncbi:MAG: hypothetical protein NTX88_03385 [Candidatus Atribacteria bacterium]|nr:hypothetical protein [Candidatus Atribacteria bacterium]